MFFLAPLTGLYGLVLFFTPGVAMGYSPEALTGFTSEFVLLFTPGVAHGVRIVRK